VSDIFSRTYSDAKKLVGRVAFLSAATTLSAAATVVAVDHWQKRHIARKSVFPHLPPQDVEIGDTSTRVYTFGEDLFEDMLAAIESAESTVYLESYIWKGDCISNFPAASSLNGPKIYGP